MAGRHVRLRELLLGFEGLALLRGLVDAPDEEQAARVEEIREIAASMDDQPYAAGTDVSEVDARGGYAVAAAGYDAEVNPLIAVEQPVVERLLEAVPAGRALDAACGTGRHAKHLARRHEVTGVDTSPEMLAVAREAVPSATFREGDLTGLPLPDAHFDAVVCGLALCHLPDLASAAAELARVGRPGARYVLSDPHPVSISILSHLFVPTEQGMGFVRNHYRSVGDYLSAFEAAGLGVVRCEEAVGDETAVSGIAASYVPGALRRALVGLPTAIVWELERA